MGKYISTLWQNNSTTIIDAGYNGLLTLAILVAGHLAAKAVRKSINRTSERFERLDITLVPILCATATYAVYAICAVIILDIFGVPTTSIIALLGAAGLAIGLALKDTLSNIAAGIMLLILRPFRVGDSVECASILGTVKEIGLFTTILETFDGLYIAAPNGCLWGAPMKNYTRNGTRRMDLIVGISYADSIEQGFNVLQEIIRNEERFLEDPAPRVMVQAMADSAVNLQLRAWTQVDDYWDTYWDQNKNIKEKIESAGLSIPFPQRDLHIFDRKPEE